MENLAQLQSSFLIVSLQCLIVVLSTFEEWAAIHLRREARTFLLHVWLQNVLTALVLVVYRRKTGDSSNLKPSLLLKPWIVQLMLLLIWKYNVKNIHTNAAGSNLQQVTLVLTVPLLLTIIIWSCNLKKENHGQLHPFKLTEASILFFISLFKLIILLRDAEAAVDLWTCSLGASVAALNAIYLLMLKIHTSQASLVYLLYYFSVFNMMTLPFISLLFGEWKYLTLHIPSLLSSLYKDALMAVLHTSSFITFWKLIPKSGLITAQVSKNFSSVFCVLIQAFIFKRDFTVATLKLIFLLVVELFAVSYWLFSCPDLIE